MKKEASESILPARWVGVGSEYCGSATAGDKWEWLSRHKRFGGLGGPGREKPGGGSCARGSGAWPTFFGAGSIDSTSRGW